MFRSRQSQRITSFICVVAMCFFTFSDVASAATVTWDGGGGDANWSTAANWNPDGAPLSADSLVFTGSANVITNNDFVAGTVFNGITFEDSGVPAGNFTLGGNDITLGAGITSNSAAGASNTISHGLILSANRFIDTAASNSLTISGDVSGASTLILNQGADLGTITLSGTNTHSGGTQIKGGTVIATNSSSFGTGLVSIRDNSSVEPVVNLDATLGALTFTNDFEFNNSNTVKILTVTGGDATISGDFALLDAEVDDGTFLVEGGSTLTLSGIVSGAGRLHIDADRSVDLRALVGGGTVILSGDNTYTGASLIEEGTLVLESDTALGATTMLTMEDRGTNPIVELRGTGRTIDRDLVISNQGGGKRLQLENTTGTTGEWSGDITVNETTNGNFDLRANSSGGNNDQTQILTVSGTITSTAGAGLDINGDGVVRLTAANDISGTVELSNDGSILRVGHNDALGGAGAATTLIDNSNTRLQIEDGISTNTANALTIGTTGNNKVLEVFDASNGVAESATFGGDISILETGVNNFDVHATDALDTLTLTGVISGSTGGVSKTGAGTVVLSGANTYTSETKLNAGILQANAADGAGTGALGNGGIIDFGGGTLQYTAASASTDYATRIQNSGTIRLDTNGQNVTLAGIIDASNTGGLRKIGDGTLTLSGANAYTGTTVVAGGTLANGANDTLNTLGNLTVGTNDATSNATYDLAGFDQTIGFITLGGNVADTGGLNHSIIDSGGTGTLNMTSGVYYNNGGANLIGMATISANLNGGGSSRTFTVEDGADDVDLLLSGNFVNTGFSLSKAGTGTMQITSTGNDYTFLNVRAGTLQINEDANLGSDDVTLGDNADTGTLEYIGTGGTIDNEFRIGQNNGDVGNSAISNTGTGTVTFSNPTFNQVRGSATVDRTLAFDGTSDIVVTGTVQDNVASTGTVGLIKNGTNTLTLNGANTYTGATNVDAGTLIVNGSTSATSIVDVDAGATLAGTGTIIGATTISGTHALGDATVSPSVGTQTFADDLTYSGANVQWQLVSNTSNETGGIAGTDFDSVDLTGTNTLTFGSSSTIDLDFTSGVDFGNSLWTMDQTWTVYSGVETLNGTLNTDFAIGSISTLGAPPGTFSLVQDGSDVNLMFTATAVPEPSSFALLALGLVGFGVRRRRPRTAQAN